MKIQLQWVGVACLALLVIGAIVADALDADRVVDWLTGAAIAGAIVPTAIILIRTGASPGGTGALLLVAIALGNLTGCGGSSPSPATLDVGKRIAARVVQCTVDAVSDELGGGGEIEAPVQTPAPGPATEPTSPPAGADTVPQEEIAAVHVHGGLNDEEITMGTFRVEVQAVGGHGCQREIGEGETVGGCCETTCPDCMARRFVADLRTIASVEQARLVHWPATPGEVRDDLLSGKRSGAFNHPHREQEHIEQFFAYGHLPPALQEVSRPAGRRDHAPAAEPRAHRRPPQVARVEGRRSQGRAREVIGPYRTSSEKPPRERPSFARRLLCRLGLHEWEQLAYSTRTLNLMHLSPRAGTLQQCRWCPAVYDDLPDYAADARRLLR